MVDGLKKLAKSDPLVVVTSEETGEHIIAGCGELHVEICINDLRKEFTNIEIVESEPIVTYKETNELIRRRNQEYLIDLDELNKVYFLT